MTPTPGTGVEQTAIMAAKSQPWMAVNTDAALYKYAQVNHLGAQQTSEFEFTFNTITYVGQVFNLGVVYCPKGAWDKCAWVKKPA